MMTTVRIPLSSGVLKLLLALALVVGVGLMSVTPALAQGQYAPPTSFNVGDIDRLDIDEDDDIIVVDEDEGSPTAGPTSSGRTPVVGTTSPGSSPAASPTSSGRVPVVGTASPTSSGRAPLTASSPEAGTAKAGRSAVQGVLPATGGPLLPVMLLAGLALAGTGMLVLRRFSGRE